MTLRWTRSKDYTAGVTLRPGITTADLETRLETATAYIDGDAVYDSDDGPIAFLTEVTEFEESKHAFGIDCGDAPDDLDQDDDNTLDQGDGPKPTEGERLAEHQPDGDLDPVKRAENQGDDPYAIPVEWRDDGYDDREEYRGFLSNEYIGEVYAKSGKWHASRPASGLINGPFDTADAAKQYLEKNGRKWLRWKRTLTAMRAV